MLTKEKSSKKENKKKIMLITRITLPSYFPLLTLPLHHHHHDDLLSIIKTTLVV